MAIAAFPLKLRRSLWRSRAARQIITASVLTVAEFLFLTALVVFGPILFVWLIVSIVEYVSPGERGRVRCAPPSACDERLDQPARGSEVY